MVILVIAMVVVGPGKLPEMAGQVGRVIREFRRTTSELSGEFSRTLSLEIEERRATETPPAAYAEPAPVEPAPAVPAYETGAHVATASEPTEAPPVVSSEPVAPAVAPTESIRGKRTYDADLAPPY